MADYRSIEIDFEVHKKIEMERHSFEESPNDVLRRLLKLPKTRQIENFMTLDALDQKIEKAASEARSGAWSGKGVTLPSGTEVRMEYNGELHYGVIKENRWVIGDQNYRSPSAAACAVGRTKEGSSTSLNGWVYWNAKRPGDEDWVPINKLR